MTQLWLWDKDASAFLAVNSNPNSMFTELRPMLKVLEWLAHGIPWLVFTSLGLLVCLRYDFDETVTDRVTILLIGNGWMYSIAD